MDVRGLTRLALMGMAGMRRDRVSFVQPGAESWPIFRANFDRGYVPPLAKIGALAMTGRLTRREPVIRYGDSPILAEFVELATRDGKSFREFIVDAVSGVMAIGQQGVLLSWASDSTYPKAVLFEPESIIKIQIDTTRDQYRPIFVELRENEEYYESGVRSTRMITRRLSLESGYYVQEIIGRGNNAQRIEMSMNGRRLDFIPFMLLNANGQRFGDSESPVWPLVEIMAAILETSIAKRSAGRKVGMPTPVLIGFGEMTYERKQETDYYDASNHDIEFFRQLNADSGGEQVIRLGSDVVLKATNPDARAFFLEINPAGLSHLADEEAGLYRLAASMGAVGVSPDQSAGEQRTATEVLYDSEDQISKLSVAAAMFSSRFTELLRWVARITGDTAVSEPDVFVEVTVNIGAQKMDPALLANLVSVVELGYLSKKTFYEILQAHGLTRADYTFEDEASEIDAQEIG